MVAKWRIQGKGDGIGIFESTTFVPLALGRLGWSQGISGSLQDTDYLTEVARWAATLRDPWSLLPAQVP